jgi:WD40 repeat protein
MRTASVQCRVFREMLWSYAESPWSPTMPLPPLRLSRRATLATLLTLTATCTGPTLAQLAMPAVPPPQPSDTPSEWINAISVSADGRLLAASSTSGAIAIWEVAGGRLIRTLAVPKTQNAVGALAFSDDSKMLFAGNAPRRRKSQGRAMIVFDVASGEIVSEQAAEPDWIVRFATSPKAKIVATIGQGFDRSVRFWSKDSFRLQRLWPAHDSAVMSLAMSRDGQRIATGGGNTQRGGKDPSIKIWEVATGHLLHKLAGHQDGAKRLAFTADGRRLVSIGYDALKVWSTDKGTLIKSSKLPAANAGEMILAPHAAWFAVVDHAPDGNNEVLSVRSVQSGSLMSRWVQPWQTATQLASSPDGGILFAGGSGGQVLVLDVKGGKQRHVFKLGEISTIAQ